MIVASTSPAAGPLRYAYLVLLMLMLAAILSFFDRILITLLIEPIRTEFGLGDAQIGLLVGFGFVLLYTFAGLPFGMLADSGNRRNLIVFGIVGWSLATMGTALATGFAGLAAARALVGIGEATLAPAAISTIVNRFPRHRLAFAMAVYSTSVAVGAGVGLIIGGQIVRWCLANSLDLPLIGTLGGWRLAFVLVGAAGIPFGLAFAFIVREAPRPALENAAARVSVLAILRTHPRAFASLLIGLPLAMMAAYVPILWAPPFFMRLHGLDASAVGAIAGSAGAVSGLVGILAGGATSDFLTARGKPDAPLFLMVIVYTAAIPFLIVAWMVPSLPAAVGLFATGSLLGAFGGALQATALQLITPPAARGRMAALLLIGTTVIGMGAGPFLVGLLSDKLYGGGGSGLGYAMSTIAGLSLLASVIVLGRGRAAYRAALAAGAGA